MKNIIFLLLILCLNVSLIKPAGAQTGQTNNSPKNTASRINPEALYKDYIDRGLYYFEKNQLSNAKYFFYNAKELMPEKPDSHINMAAIAMKRKNFLRAIMILGESLKLDDKTKQDVIFCNLGSCFQKLSKYDEAANYYAKALELNPALGNALLNLGMLRFKEGREDIALIDILKARVVFKEQNQSDVTRACDEILFPIVKNHKGDKKLADWLMREGSVSFENKRNEEAAALLKISVLIYPDNPESHYRLAVVYTNSRNFDEALYCFKKTIELNPQNVKAYMNMGAIFGEMKEYKEALRVLHKALKLEKNNPKIYYNIAMAYMGTADKKRAAGYLKKAKVLAAKNKDSKLLLRIDEAYKAL